MFTLRSFVTPSQQQKKNLLTQWRYLKVLYLVYIGAAWSGVEGRDKCRKLAFQHEIIIPRPAVTGIQLLLFLSWHRNIS